MAITNYVDVGLEVATDYATANGDAPPANGAALAVAWQVHGHVYTHSWQVVCSVFQCNELPDDEGHLCTCRRTVACW